MSSIGPPTGMRDWLPQDALLRQRLMETISSVYRLYGYLPIDTPVMENLAVLLGKGGGENEKLLFKVLKRGDKLKQAMVGGDVADYGLRYDLTVPLARFVATHQGKIPKVFRRYHIGPVWRADSPQKGRFREFYQCDIDVVGGATFNYEVEIITATERVLKELNLGRYRFRLSDKRLLPWLLEGYGVPKEHIGPITIVLDKLDKLSLDEVCGEIRKILSVSPAVSEKVENFVREADPIRKVECGRAPYLFDKILRDLKHTSVHDNLDDILNNIMVINSSVHMVNSQSGVVPDPILVRGMDYYTGPIFEAVVEGYPSAILGGGRYDGLIGQLAGKNIPAVGCSIGFERILAILQERGGSSSMSAVAKAILINDGTDAVILQQQAEQLRNEGLCIETNLDTDDVSRQLKSAESAGILWAIKHFDKASSSVTVRFLPERKDLTMHLPEFKARLSSKEPA